MKNNPIIETMLNRNQSVNIDLRCHPMKLLKRWFAPDSRRLLLPSFAACSYSADRKDTPFKAPLLFIVCVDSHKWELIMAERDWTMETKDPLLLLLGMQDAALMAENMVIAAESLGMGSCFLGGMPFNSKALIEKFKLPERVFPMVGLTMGYPAEDPPPVPVILWTLCFLKINILSSRKTRSKKPCRSWMMAIGHKITIRSLRR